MSDSTDQTTQTIRVRTVTRESAEAAGLVHVQAREWKVPVSAFEQVERERADMPAFLEISPGRYEAIEKCTPDQIRRVAARKKRQAQALMDEARRLHEAAARAASAKR
ncbi:hypothetical protein [Streptomyces sp. NPDC101455]|uniref:hypothetical protein n=1 Tax=Streptomyces sp. NPDC101455 TaxID=3366142 RepID=UPI003806E2B5